MAEPTMPSIAPLAAPDFEAFASYLDDHLRDNGSALTGYFQSQSRHQSGLPPERLLAFRQALSVPLDEPGWRRAWVARTADGCIIGHVDLRAHPQAHTSHRGLLGMGVDRAHRRQALGQALLRHATQWAREEAGLAWLDLQVLSHNLAAKALYQREGFVQIGEIAAMFRIDGQEMDYSLMAKRL
ncbi:GNAT family N-acetyltransferase [Paucibacter sp. KCTC 42545]|uniref:GNAT family N-acetyltransferase n=1 Tax=Paucibacter sp. KCTC 42545 TaxID=1768242 RepID=UPI000733AD13|nr:GNAT family N-acetyltransferase [Paucibacter sp. KCTC 42545]ALT78534.1 hypothetical protein AT984_16395 [Paucibacter sp. KCTC 42545]